jgi:hypothetical protein
MSDWRWRILFIFLLGTTVCGLILRLQLAGIDTGAAGLLDWRRAHSHLGYYGFLFPAAWICWTAEGHWTPTEKIFGFYTALVIFSFVGFLAQGYGVIATVGSTLVLAVWLFFAWKNRTFPGFRQGSVLSAVPLNIVFAACCIPVIAISTSRSPELVAPAVRTFMTILLLGVFVPSLIGRLDSRATAPILWVFLTLLSAADASGFVDSAMLRAGTVGYGVLLMTLIFKTRLPPAVFPFWLAGHWMIFAFGLILRGLGILPGSHPVMIAGLHFLVLGPIFLSLLRLQLRLVFPVVLQIFYNLSLAVMISAIVAQQWWPEHMILLQRTAAASGAAIIAALGFIFVWALKSSNLDFFQPAISEKKKSQREHEEER